MKALFGSPSVLCRRFFFFKAYALIETHLFSIHEFLSVWLTAKHGVEQNMDPVEEHVKKTIVTAARETWEIYFSRLFPASVREACPQRIVIFGLILIGPLCLCVCLCRVVLEQVSRCCQCPTVASSCWRLSKAALLLQTTSECCGLTRMFMHADSECCGFGLRHCTLHVCVFSLLLLGELYTTPLYEWAVCFL